VWTDVADDLGIPRDISLGVTQRAQRSRVEDLPQETSRTTGQSKFHSRNLDRDERRGVWVFLGFSGDRGCWEARWPRGLPSPRTLLQSRRRRHTRRKKNNQITAGHISKFFTLPFRGFLAPYL